MQEDPLDFSAGDSNLRRFVGNSPTTAIDPSGLAEDDEIERAVKSGTRVYSRGNDDLNEKNYETARITITVSPAFLCKDDRKEYVGVRLQYEAKAANDDETWETIKKLPDVYRIRGIFKPLDDVTNLPFPDTAPANLSYKPGPGGKRLGTTLSGSVKWKLIEVDDMTLGGVATVYQADRVGKKEDLKDREIITWKVRVQKTAKGYKATVTELSMVEIGVDKRHRSGDDILRLIQTDGGGAVGSAFPAKE